jgi:DNA repair protein RadC
MLSLDSAAATPCVATEVSTPGPSGSSISDCRLFLPDGETFREANNTEVLACARAIISQHFRPGAPVLKDINLMEQFLRLQLAPRDREVFAALFLNRRGRLVRFVEMFHGTVDRVDTHKREIIREALIHNATAVVFARNDVAGCPEPTMADRGKFAQLEEAFALLEIAVFDYLIIGETTTFMRHTWLTDEQRAAQRRRSGSASRKPSRRKTKASTIDQVT